MSMTLAELNDQALETEVVDGVVIEAATSDEFEGDDAEDDEMQNDLMEAQLLLDDCLDIIRPLLKLKTFSFTNDQRETIKSKAQEVEAFLAQWAAEVEEGV